MKTVLIRGVYTTSLILLGALAILWVRSARSIDAGHLFIARHSDRAPYKVWAFDFTSYYPGILTAASAGSLNESKSTDFLLSHRRLLELKADPAPADFKLTIDAALKDSPFLTRLGFKTAKISVDQRNQKSVTYSVLVPHWFAMIIAASPVLYGLVAAGRRRWRRVHNLCSNCGYDLRATKDRCPECGRVVGANKADPKAATA